MKRKKRKPSLQSIADRHGISRQTLYKYRDNGVDIYDDEAIKQYRLNIPGSIQATKPKFVKDPSLQPELELNDSKSIYEQIDKATNFEQARFLKMKSDAKIQAHKYEVEIGNYTKNSEIRENILRIGSAIKAALLRYESDLPPMLEGLTAAKVQKIIRQKNNHILSMFSNLSAELYKDD